ncbi:hypothetical protein [Paenibacillus lautus]|uniref:hypothetical protein n=1 Tax=Paenibacillus lautus TaxID=1401 RepID=UPI003D9A77A7
MKQATLPPLHSLIAPFQPFAYPFGHRLCPLAFVLTAAINLVDWGKNSRIVRRHRILHQTILHPFKMDFAKKAPMDSVRSLTKLISAFYFAF